MRLNRHVAYLCCGVSLMTVNSLTQAATNQATWPGGGVTLGNSGVVTVNAATISIVKEARLLDGTNLGATSTLPAGTQIYFVLYVDNNTTVSLTNVQMVDLIDTVAFNIDTTSFQVLNNAGTGIQMTAGNTAAWAGSATWNALTWNAQTAVTAGDDYLDYNVNVANRVTIGNLGGVPNVQLNVPVSGVPATEPYRTAFRFKATLN